MAKPEKVEIRAYNVGFGDCFLLTFVYARSQKHVLIDFGTTQPPADNKDVMTQVANAIGEFCKRLDAIVVTHRHKDHIGGFVTNNAGTAPGDIIRGLTDEDTVIIQPWTEDPDAPTKSTGAVHRSAKAKAFVQQLDFMNAFAANVAAETQRLNPATMDAAVGEPVQRAEAIGTEMEQGDDEVEEIRREAVTTDFAGTTASKSLKKRLAFIGEDNVKNVSAVKNLIEMSTKANHHYVHFGTKSGLEKILPGVKVHVLGPPTIDQYDAVRKQRSSDPEEFWQLRKSFWRMQALNAERVAAGEAPRLFPRAKTISLGAMPRESRWFVRRLRGARAKQLLELVLIMDEAMNNTSVILLFEVGDKKLLFPGDAQIENWEFALKNPDEKKRKEILDLLADVDVYKVGHHGSRNATPKTLWANFKKRTENENARKRLTTMISTKSGVHGSMDRNTEVPRKTLVDAFKKESNFLTTTKQRKVTEPVVETIDV